MEIVEKLGHRPPRRARASFAWLIMFILVALLSYVSIYLSFHLEEGVTMRVEEHFLHADKDVHAPLDRDRDALIAAKSDREAHKAPKRDRDSNNATERHGAAHKAPKRDFRSNADDGTPPSPGGGVEKPAKKLEDLDEPPEVEAQTDEPANSFEPGAANLRDGPEENRKSNGGAFDAADFAHGERDQADEGSTKGGSNSPTSEALDGEKHARSGADEFARGTSPSKRTANARAAVANNQTGAGAPVGVTNIVKDVHAPLDRDRDALIATKSDREAHKASERDRDSKNVTKRDGAAYKAPKRDRDNHITAKMVDVSHKASERNGDADKAAKRDGATNATTKRYRAVNEDNRTTNARAAIANNETGVGDPVGVTNIVAARNITPIVTYGPPRTASTLQFNFVCVCLFVHLVEYYANLANETLCYAQGEGQFLKTDRPQVMKTHTLKMNYAEKSVIFGTARTKHKGEEAAAKWEKHNSTVGLIQDMETLSKIGMGGYLDLYTSYFNLPSRYVPMLNEYFELWEKLRICCGAQMSKHWRHELNPNATPHKVEPHPFCGSLDIDEVEGGFMNTSMFKLIDAHDLERSINGPSQVDGKLDGTYCSRYNNAVRTKGLSHNQLLGQ